MNDFPEEVIEDGSAIEKILGELGPDEMSFDFEDGRDAEGIREYLAGALKEEGYSLRIIPRRHIARGQPSQQGYSLLIEKQEKRQG